MKRSEKNKKLHEEINNEELDKIKKIKRKRFIITISIIIIIIASLFSYMRYVGTSGLFVREYKITTTKIPEEFHGYKIIQFSDLHYGTTIGKKEVKALIEKINLLKPDLVIFTGDLIDRYYAPTAEDITFLTEQLNKIKVTTSKYAVKGDQDYINDNFVNIMTNSSFQILNNTYDLIYYEGYNPILITGIGSNINNDVDINSAFSYTITENADVNAFTIALLHEPDLISNEIKDYSVDLALAGHSLNGQVRLPIVGDLFKVKGSTKYSDMEYMIGNTKLYISGGIGVNKYKFRLFDRPSINLYRLTTH